MELGERERRELERECLRLRASRDSLQDLVDDLRRELADRVLDLRSQPETARRDQTADERVSS